MKWRLFRVDAVLVNRRYVAGVHWMYERVITYSCYQMAETAEDAVDMVKQYYMPLNAEYDYMQAESCEEVEA